MGHDEGGIKHNFIDFYKVLATVSIVAQTIQNIEEQMAETLRTIISRVKKDSLWILISLVISLVIGLGLGELIFM